MKPHETFELIVSLVCAKYNLHWREVLLCYPRKNQRDRSQARKIINHLSYVFIGHSFVEDIIGVHYTNISKHNAWCRENKDKVTDIKELVAIARNAKRYYLKNAA